MLLRLCVVVGDLNDAPSDHSYTTLYAYAVCTVAAGKSDLALEFFKRAVDLHQKDAGLTTSQMGNLYEELDTCLSQNGAQGSAKGRFEKAFAMKKIGVMPR